MKVAITGSTGHLGAALVKELVQRDYTLNVLVREDVRALNLLNVNKTKGTILSPEALIKLMDGCGAIIHCAGEISINGDKTGSVYKTNVEGTRAVVQAALNSGVKRFIHISSIHVYQQHPINEKLDEKRPYVHETAFLYDRSKLAGQQIALKANNGSMEVIVINPTALLGPPDYKTSLLGKAVIDMYKGRIPAMFDGGFDFCDTRDVAHAVVNSLKQGKPGENYLLGGKWFSMKQFEQILSKVSGKKINRISVPAGIARAALPLVKLFATCMHSEPVYTQESIEALVNGNRNICYEKAIKELGYHSRPFEETMQDTFNWFRENGYLNN